MGALVNDVRRDIDDQVDNSELLPFRHSNVLDRKQTCVTLMP